MARPAVIFDLDGTLADCDHRRHLVDLTVMRDPSKIEALVTGKDWEQFKALAHLDPVKPDILRLLHQLSPYNRIVICTGRDDSQRAITESWLRLRGVHYDALYMRNEGDFRPDTVVKSELLLWIRSECDPWLVIDDRDSVVEMFRAEGITCLQCVKGDY